MTRFLSILLGAGSVASAHAATLELPRSTATLVAQGEVTIAVGTDTVDIGGRPVITLEAGARVADDAKRGQLVTGVYDALLEVAETAKRQAREEGPEFRGVAVLRIDAGTPFSTVRELVYSAGQAQFGTMLFAVDGPKGEAHIRSTLPHIGPPEAPGPAAPELNLVLRVTADGFWVQGDDPRLGGREGARLLCGKCDTVDSYPASDAVRLLRAIKQLWPDEDTVIVVPAAVVRWDAVVRGMDASRDDALSGSGDFLLFPNLILAGGAD